MKEMSREVLESQFSFNIAHMGQQDAEKLRAESGAQNPTKVSDKSQKHTEYFSLEPNENEQASSNPFYAPMQNRTGSIDSAEDIRDIRTSQNFGGGEIIVENLDNSRKSKGLQ